MEQIIQEKLAGRRSEEVLDAFDYMLSSAQDQGQSLSPQELKVITLTTPSTSSLSPRSHYLTTHYPA
jgi:cytochrome P450